MFSNGESFHESCGKEQVHSHFLQANADKDEDADKCEDADKDEDADKCEYDDVLGALQDFFGDSNSPIVAEIAGEILAEMSSSEGNLGIDITGSDGKVLFGESLPPRLQDRAGNLVLQSRGKGFTL
jgi:hypothetical protein